MFEERKESLHVEEMATIKGFNRRGKCSFLLLPMEGAFPSDFLEQFDTFIFDCDGETEQGVRRDGLTGNQVCCGGDRRWFLGRWKRFIS